MCCEVCSFKDDLPGWVKNNSDLNDNEITDFCNRVLAVFFEFENLGFDFTMGFSFRELEDENADAITKYQIPHVFVKGERFGNEVMVEFFTHNSLYIMSSKKSEGLNPCDQNSFESMNFARYIDDSISSWQCVASLCIESAINMANIPNSSAEIDNYEKFLLRQKLGGDKHG